MHDATGHRLGVHHFGPALPGLRRSADVGEQIGTEFDLDGLLRMDAVAQVDVVAKKKGIATLDEQRRDLNLKPQPGGDTIYLQQQDHSLAAIAARDEQLIADAKAPAPAPAPANDNPAAASLALAASVRRSIRNKRLADA